MSTQTPAPASPPAATKTKANFPVLIGSSIGILAIAIWAMLDPTGAETVIWTVVAWVGGSFGWYYTALVVAVLVFVIIIAASKVGRTRLGPDHSRPHFNLFTWTAMLFAAGIGVDLMFYSVAEPVTQYMSPPTGEGETVEAARQALVWTLFHYGLLGWGLYALMGLALAYFAYRHNLPLSIRAALYPIIGKRINGGVGHAVDIAAMLGTIFGIATSLGIGVAQLSYGLHFMFGLPDNLTMQIALIALAVVMATISVVSGVDKGIRRLSEINIILAISLLAFVLITGKTTYLLDSIVQNVGDMLARFPGMALDTFAYDRPDDWLNAWTLFFWAWWIAWAPFVGLFLARISRGRTIRQFVTGVLVVPFAFIALWISIFGSGALDIVMNGADGAAFAEVAINAPEQAFYGLLDQYPLVPLTAGIATFTGLLFYVTSADSGALVMANFTSKLKDSDSDGPNWLRIFWAVVTGVLTLAMLLVGGISALQSATVIMGLPFSVVLIFIMIGLAKALRVEGALVDSYRRGLPAAVASRGPTGERRRGWRERLSRAMSYPSSRQTQRFIVETALPALEEVRAELAEQGVTATLTSNRVDEFGIDTADLYVDFGDDRAFKYQVFPVQQEMPSYARASAARDKYYRVEPFTLEGSHGYDLYGYSRDQVISDVLNHYEVHLEFLHTATGALPTTSVGEQHNVTTEWGHDYDSAPEPDASGDELTKEGEA
ncbi:choline BCCT transporter BetT [Microbacterium karelineae]|uniref:choline BCCT transporter BetT n=1 Tax=Microbacterium karelineae TaxID=2654283 RepID=UPI0012E9EC3B|nr:choline BCCT transporter BetT [Microbacterium karelineae]